MTDSMKATRAVVEIGSFTVYGFMLPDGSYRMSQSQAAECIGRPEINARRFLESKAIKALLGKSYTPDTIEIVSNGERLRGQSRFNALPLEVVTAYWLTQANQGNQQAISLVWALLIESLERRFDDVFGVSRTELERNQRLSEKNQQLEADLTRLGEAYALEDEIRRERDYFEQLLRQNGIDPYALPDDADGE